MSKIPHPPVCVVCTPVPYEMVGTYLKRDGFCKVHSAEYDLEESLKQWELWMEDLGKRSVVSAAHAVAIAWQKQQAGVHWLEPDRAIAQEVDEAFERLFGNYFERGR
jgi:hypothetical protein